ncbi:DNA-primase RepB domain-containing protein [Acetobacter sp.]|uniref:DNA-primase RepB domain-containing protein n=1 Tax=Acetobacter sp. TaxID=440 RepID=UPI0039EAB457
MEISKEEVARLRRLDPAGVHAALIASGDLSINTAIPKRIDSLRPLENAIDAVKFARKCDYNQALGWLHEHFADDQTHERNVGIRTVERELFDSEIVINKLVKQQMDALGCSEARLTLMFKEADESSQKDALLETVTESDFEKMPSEQDAEPEKRKGKFGYLVGKRTQNGEKVEKFFNTKDIQNCVGMLRQRNGEGLNVLLTPMDRHCFYILVDDALDRQGKESESPVKSWIDEGFKPCLALQTSWNSHQIIFRVPKEPFRIKDTVGNDDSCFDRSGLHQYFQSLNRDFGDHRISGLRHGIRLAGYRNVKPKHAREVEGKAWGVEYPFVKIAHAESTFCEKTLNDALKMCSHKVVGNIERTKQALLNHRNGVTQPRQVMPPRSVSGGLVRPIAPRQKSAWERKIEEREIKRETQQAAKKDQSLCR